MLQGMHKSMEARYEQRVVPFYCLDPAKYPLDEFLSDVKLFVDHFEVGAGWFVLMSLGDIG